MDRNHETLKEVVQLLKTAIENEDEPVVRKACVATALAKATRAVVCDSDKQIKLFADKNNVTRLDFLHN